MKALLTSALVALTITIPSLPSASGAQIAESYEAAAQLPKKDGYLVFAYAQGWDSFSKGICDKLMQDASIQQAAGESIFLGMPVFQYAKQDQRAFQASILDDLAIIEAESYPAIIMYTPHNRHYATICGAVMMRANPEELAPIISQRIQAMHQQEDLLAQADQAEGIEKAKLLGKAARIPGAKAPQNIKTIIKTLDPDDKTGYVRSLWLDDFVFTEDFIYETQGIKDPNKPRPERSAGSLEDALSKLDKMLEDPAYTNEQKQTFCANAIGAIHRLGDANDRDTIKKYAAKMKELGPDTTLGRSAESVVYSWARSVSVEKGWGKHCIPKDDTPMEVEGKLPFDKSGTYTIKFQWTGGTDSLNIKGVRLYNDKRLVSEDMHDGTAGYANQAVNNTYTITVRNKLNKPHLYVIFDAGEKRNSTGKLIIERQ